VSGFVLDVSVTMAWRLANAATPETWAILDRLQDEGAVVPALWPLEVANVLLLAERRKRTTTAQAGAFVDPLLRLPIRVEEQTVQRTLRDVYALGRSAVLTAYDAGYLELAIRSHLPLATTDRALAAAAREAGVPVLPDGA
jgi:predicted nucleic acid-binding protein